MEGVKNRGVGGLEMLAMEMKASGSYLSRGLSYRNAEFELKQVALTQVQRSMFDAASRFWSDQLLPAVESAAAKTQTPLGALTRLYWSAVSEPDLNLPPARAGVWVCRTDGGSVLLSRPHGRIPSCQHQRFFKQVTSESSTLSLCSRLWSSAAAGARMPAP